MKKTLSIVLAAIMLVSSLAGCAGVTSSPSISSNIRVTSSDGADVAAWLDARLGDKLTDRIVLGTDADGYGVDVGALEDDGYFIRSLGGEIALFARTTDGLDRAVRKYAKMVEAGSVTDVTYHEGYRVKRIEIAGREIGEYTICCEDEPNILRAANELSSRIQQACGVKLAVSTTEPAAPYIALRYVHDEALGNVGFHWSVDEGGLTLEISDNYKQNGAFMAVRRFLEVALDWTGLTFGIEDLAPSELVSLGIGDGGTEKNAFVEPHFYGGYYGHFDRIDNPVTWNQYGPMMIAMHGLSKNRIAGELSATWDWTTDQPCFLDEEFYELSLEGLSAYVDAQIASGKKLGEDFVFLDISTGDNGNWCSCKKCTKLYRDEGGANSAAVLTWANRVSEALDAKYPGISYGVLAYYGTNKPPKTVKPNDNIVVTFCYDAGCAAHTLDGSHCATGHPVFNYMPYGGNAELSGFLRGWLELTPNVYVWYYLSPNGLVTMSFIHNVREDVRFLADLGVRGVFLENESIAYDTGWLLEMLAMSLSWKPHMDDTEYELLYSRLLRSLYGDAAKIVRQYIELEDRFYECGPCVCASYVNTGVSPSVNMAMWRENYDTMFALTESAIRLADSALQERRLVNLGCVCIYKGSLASYFDAYNAYDDERVAELCRRYALIDERLSEYGVDMTKPKQIDVYRGGGYAYDWASGKTLLLDGTYERDLEMQAWTKYWIDLAVYTGIEATRAMPERVAAIIAERGE